MLAGARGRLLLAAIMALSIGVRVMNLGADPPPVVSSGPNPNEGFYAHNARNAVMDGAWTIDDWDGVALTPLGSVTTAAVFRLTGAGLYQARLLAVIFSLLALVLFYGLIREASGRATALLATLFLGTYSVFLVYSRQANPAPLGILLMLATILLWRLGARHQLLALAAGVGLALAAVIENAQHGVFFLAAGALATLMVRLQAWKMPWAGRVRRRVHLFWGGTVLTLIAWALLFVAPRWSSFHRMLETPLSTARWGNILQNIYMAPFILWRLIQWMPVTWVVVLIYFLVFARSLFGPIARHNPLSETRVWFFAWLVAGPAFMSCRFDRPLGVLVLIVPPLCMAAAEALAALLSLRQVRKPPLDIMVVLGLMALVTWFGVQVAVHSAVLLGSRWIPAAFARHQFRFEFLLVLLIAAPLTVLVASLWLRWKKFTLNLRPRTVTVGFGLLVAGIVALNGRVPAAIFKAGHEIDRTAGALGVLPRGAVVAGTWSPVLALDNRWRGLVVWPGMNDHDPIGRQKVTHLLLQRGSSEDLGFNPVLRRMGGDLRRRLHLVRSLRLGGHDLDLYEVRPAVTAGG